MVKTNTKYSNSMEEIEVAVKSSSPFVWVRTHEEGRFLSTFAPAMEKTDRKVFLWSVYSGLQHYEESKVGVPNKETADIIKALDKIDSMDASNSDSRGIVIILKDPMIILQATIVRRLRDSRERYVRNKITFVLLSPFLGHGPEGATKANGIPSTLEKEFIVCNYTLPDIDTINQQLRNITKMVVKGNMPKPDWSKAKVDAANAQIEKFKYTEEQFIEYSRALQGLTENEIQVAATSCFHHMKTLDSEFLINAKKQIISRSDILEYLELNKSMSEIGGMDLAKQFFEDYKLAHSEDARKFGVDPLKAVLLVGMPGCGKSQLAKAVASLWKIALLRMDIGKVMTGLVGGSEQRMRDAIAQVEAVQPCVLWIDEVEKGLSGTGSSNFSDGGTMARVFGTLLTSMEEGMKGVTIIATANDISALPPEFIRRFDEVLFVDLPGPEEREEIFKIHLKIKGQDFTDLDLKHLVSISENFTGHEIEKAVKRSITFAYNSKEKKVVTEQLVQALTEKQPLFNTMREKLSKLREKAADRFRFASSWARDQAKGIIIKQKSMSVDDIDLPSMETKKSNNEPVISLD